MTTPVRRAGAFAVVGTLVLLLPAFGPQAAGTVAAAVLVGAAAVTDGPVFELFARPGDREERRLYGLIGFALAAIGLGLLTVSDLAGTGRVPTLPVGVYVGTVLLLVYGNLSSELVKLRRADPFAASAGFVVGGFTAAVVGQVAASLLLDQPLAGTLPKIAFLAITGALIGALLRAALFERDDPVVLFTVGLVLWLLSALAPAVHRGDVAAAIGVALALGYLSFALRTASVEGMLTGILLSILTIVLGGVGWFAVLISFFSIGALSTKYRYDTKAERGVAEGNDGARGTGNVLGNAAVATVAVLGFAAASSPPGFLAVDGTLFLFAFAGSIATALSDTLASEIGAVFDSPRLVTTLERVEPGTDGAVTWQGELAGFVGAGLVAGIVLVVFPAVDPSATVGTLGAGVVLVAGVAGMTVDSLLGATVEDDLIGNQGVNFFATLAGAVVAVLVAVVAGGVAVA
ncbi:DUF92 domain-containing protein [Haloarchaeobius sp. HRN-SO-5]|uniref:DUF92 domain-containing protein n=1 Tax=Haloarchaeobius sp. HRN-SO-5 TaxID=3446118 RepID=UPI003EB77840